MLLVDAVHEAGPLIPRPTPVIEKAIDDAGILKHDIVDVSVRLTIQGHRAENSKVQKAYEYLVTTTTPTHLHLTRTTLWLQSLTSVGIWSRGPWDREGVPGNSA